MATSYSYSPLRPWHVRHLNLATNTGGIPLTDAMAVVFNDRFGTNVSRVILNVLWHHSPFGPHPSKLTITPLASAQVQLLKNATDNGRIKITQHVTENFNSRFETAFEQPYLEDLFRLSDGGPGLEDDSIPSLRLSVVSRLRY